jgi:hypothetical protein
MEDLEKLKNYLKEQKTRLQQMVAIRNRIETESWKDTKRLLSISITNMETSMLYLKEAIEEQKRLPAQRYS